MADFTADFEAGVHGATITTGAGEASATAWFNVDGTPTYSNTQVAHGTLSAEVNAAQWLEWIVDASTPTYGRFYFLFSSNPSAEEIILGARIDADFSIRISDTGKVVVHDSDANGGHSMTSTASVSTGSWVRFEYFVVFSTTVGQVIVRFFNTMDSSTPTEELSSPATWWTGSGTPMPIIKFGCQFGRFPSAIYFDDIVANATNWVGPVPAVAPQVLAMQTRVGRHAR